MNWCKQVAVLIFGTLALGALAQSVHGMHLGVLMQSEPVVQATVCDIVNNPAQFEGKLVRVRAQITSDIYLDRQFWINEVTMKSGKVCDFLKARINGPTHFAGANGSGTFTGRLVRESVPLNFEASVGKIRLVFIVEQEFDVYGLEYLNGPVRGLQLYDKQTSSFIKPEQDYVPIVIRCDSARPVPGTSKTNVRCFETNLPANYDGVSLRMVFRP